MAQNLPHHLADEKKKKEKLHLISATSPPIATSPFAPLPPPQHCQAPILLPPFSGLIRLASWRRSRL